MKNLNKPERKDKMNFYSEEKIDINLLKEEIRQKGGMTTQELIERLGAIPFEDFINHLRQKVREI